jgi:hypothetical protein
MNTLISPALKLTWVRDSLGGLCATKHAPPRRDNKKGSSGLVPAYLYMVGFSSNPCWTPLERCRAVFSTPNTPVSVADTPLERRRAVFSTPNTPVSVADTPLERRRAVFSTPNTPVSVANTQLERRRAVFSTPNDTLTAYAQQIYTL